MKPYDSNQVSLIIGPINVDSGRAKGPFVRVENVSDDFGDDVGADGEVVRFKTNDDRATVTVILMQSSATNQAFSALRNADKLAPNGAGVVPFMLKDNNSDTMLLEGKDCWIKKAPNVERGAEPGTVEWTFMVASVVRNEAGY